MYWYLIWELDMEMNFTNNFWLVAHCDYMSSLWWQTLGDLLSFCTSFHLYMLNIINNIILWKCMVSLIITLLCSLFFKQEMELSLIGLQNAGKTSLVNVVAVILKFTCLLMNSIYICHETNDVFIVLIFNSLVFCNAGGLLFVFRLVDIAKTWFLQ